MIVSWPRADLGVAKKMRSFDSHGARDNIVIIAKNRKREGWGRWGENLVTASWPRADFGVARKMMSLDSHGARDNMVIMDTNIAALPSPSICTHARTHTRTRIHIHIHTQILMNEPRRASPQCAIGMSHVTGLFGHVIWLF